MNRPAANHNWGLGTNYDLGTCTRQYFSFDNTSIEIFNALYKKYITFSHLYNFSDDPTEQTQKLTDRQLQFFLQTKNVQFVR